MCDVGHAGAGCRRRCSGWELRAIPTRSIALIAWRPAPREYAVSERSVRGRAGGAAWCYAAGQRRVRSDGFVLRLAPRAWAWESRSSGVRQCAGLAGTPGRRGRSGTAMALRCGCAARTAGAAGSREVSGLRVGCAMCAAGAAGSREVSGLRVGCAMCAAGTAGSREASGRRVGGTLPRGAQRGRSSRRPESSSRNAKARSHAAARRMRCQMGLKAGPNMCSHTVARGSDGIDEISAYARLRRRAATKVAGPVRAAVVVPVAPVLAPRVGEDPEARWCRPRRAGAQKSRPAMSPSSGYLDSASEQSMPEIVAASMQPQLSWHFVQSPAR